MNRKSIDVEQNRLSGEHRYLTFEKRSYTDSNFFTHDHNRNNLDAATEKSMENMDIKNLPKLINARGHYRNRSESSGIAFNSFASKQNPGDSKEDSLQSGGRIKLFEQRLKDLEKRVQSTQFFLFRSTEGQDKGPEIQSNIIELIGNLLKKRTDIFEENIINFSSQLEQVKSHLQELSPTMSQISYQPSLKENKGKSAFQTNLKAEELEQKLTVMILRMKNELSAHVSDLKERIKKVKVKKDYEQSANPEIQFFRTNRKYSGNPISFLYEQFIRKKENEDEKKRFQGEQRIRINKITYYIDTEGFLLDNEGLYLVNSRNQQIKLSEKELRMLKKNNILEA